MNIDSTVLFLAFANAVFLLALLTDGAELFAIFAGTSAYSLTFFTLRASMPALSTSSSLEFSNSFLYAPGTFLALAIAMNIAYALFTAPCSQRLAAKPFSIAGQA